MDVRARFGAFVGDVVERPDRHGRHARLAVERQLRDEAAPPAGCRFRLDAGVEVADWIERHCTFSAGELAGQPFALQPWQAFVVCAAFGWLRSDGRRRFSALHLWVPRKAGKSELAGAIGLYMLVADGEQAPLVVSTASSERQARIVAAAAWRMAGRIDAPGLRRNRMSHRNPPVVEIEGGGGTFSGLPRDQSGSLDGLSPHCAVIDELHAYASSATYDAMAEGMGARPNSLLVVISTAGDLDGIGRQQHDLAAAVVEGEIAREDLFAFISAAERDEDIGDEATWRRANPSLGATVSVDYVRSRHAEAVATGRTEVFRRKQLNQWPPRGAGDLGWIAEDAWDACAGDLGKPGRRAWAGLSSSAEGCAAALVWRRGPEWRLRIGTWRTTPEAVRWLARKARRRRLQVAFDPVRHGPMRGLEESGAECVAVERSARNLAFPMRTLRELVAARRVTQRSTDAARREVLATVDDPLASGLPRPPDADAPAAALSALAVALADGGRGATMRDIPDWDSI